jgi:hypothetical protein
VPDLDVRDVRDVPSVEHRPHGAKVLLALLAAERLEVLPVQELRDVPRESPPDGEQVNLLRWILPVGLDAIRSTNVLPQIGIGTLIRRPKATRTKLPCAAPATASTLWVTSTARRELFARRAARA